MIRLIQRRLIIPRGDTGTFTVPVIATKNTGDVAVFSIIDNMTAKKVFEKIVQVSGDTMTIEFSHNETVNLPVGKYVWDIKFYQNPEFADGALINGVEVDSYYAAFTMPVCEIRQTGDNLLMADDAPGTELSASQLDILNATVNETNAAKNTAVESASTASAAASTATENAATAVASAEEATAALNELKEILPSLAEVATSGSYEDLEDKPFIPSRVSDLTDDSGHYTKPANGIPASDLEETYLTEHQDLSNYVQKTDYATTDNAGIVKYNENLGIAVTRSGLMAINPASSENIKSGGSASKPIVPTHQHESTFYGLAKAAGDTTQSQSNNAVGTYTDGAKTAIQTMLDVPSNAAMTTAISSAIGNINSFDMVVVQELPTQDISTHTIYLVPKTGETNDVYDEYIYINDAWEMVGNTQIDLSNYVQKTDYATASEAGVVKVNTNQGITVGNNGIISTYPAIHSNIKDGTSGFKPLTPYYQHEATFYGLAKAAGDSTQSQSSNAVGTYTDEAKTAIQQMLDVPSTGDIPDTSIYVTKESIDNAGITDRTYVTKYDGSITTALDSTYESPWCELPNVDGRFACMVYRVTFDNVIYELRAGLFNKYYNKAAKGVEFIGDLSIYIDPTGCLYEVYDVPFCIIDNAADYADGLLVFSKIAGEHTLKLELELLNYNKLSPELLYGKSEPPILWKHNSSSSYFGVSVGSGSNILEQTRNVIAIGSGNKISADNGHAYGVDNVISGLRSIAIGLRNNTTGQDNYAFGYNCSTSNEGSLAIGYLTQSSGGYGSIATGYATTASGMFSHSEGSNSIASGSASHAENMLTTASGSNSHAEGWRTIANHRSQHVFGQANVADPSTAAATALGTYAEIVGNGTADNARSNAYALTWTGDGHYAGDVYVHANADSTGGTKLATIEDIPDAPVQDVQVNGISVLADGVANVPMAIVSGEQIGSAKIADFYMNGKTWAQTASAPGAVALGFNVAATSNGAFAEGAQTTASGTASHAEGMITKALGDGAHAEGRNNTASAPRAHAEGQDTEASAYQAHSEGFDTLASGINSHAEGTGTIANSYSLHAGGTYNVENSYALWPEWVAGTEYTIGDKVKVTIEENGETVSQGYVCKVANNDSIFTASKWTIDYYMDFAEIIGNGTDDVNRSNARALEWNGNEHLAGDLYIQCNSDSTGGKKVATINDILVQDVQVNGTSVVTDGVANVPKASSSVLGVMRVGSGLISNAGGEVYIPNPNVNTIKAGNGNYSAVTIGHQHESTFYGLAKAAGSDEKNSALPVGQYTDAAKEAIQSMLGVSQMLAPVNPNMTAAQAYKVGEVFAANGKLYKATAAIAQDAAIIPDTNCEETTMAEAGGKIRDVQVNSVSIVGNDGVASVPVANLENVLGLVKVHRDYGLNVYPSGLLAIAGASDSSIKEGSNNGRPISCANQHKSIFYGLSKAAGVDLANETVTLGTYPEASKTAIKQMLGVEEGLKVVRLI